MHMYTMHAGHVFYLQTNDLETGVLAPLHAWIKEYRTFKDKLSVLDNRRLEFDAERRAFHKLELKKVHQQQATDKAEPELMGKLEAKSGDVAGDTRPYHCQRHVALSLHLSVQPKLYGNACMSSMCSEHHS